MVKFTIIYRRTIQTQKYHTSTIGLSIEHDTAITPFKAAYYEAVKLVEEMIKEELSRVKGRP